jgi:hypothetical protein
VTTARTPGTVDPTDRRPDVTDASVRRWLAEIRGDQPTDNPGNVVPNEGAQVTPPADDLRPVRDFLDYLTPPRQ